MIFTINDLGDEYHTVIPGPLVEVQGIPRHKRINIPTVLEFCDTIINGIKDKSIKIPSDIPTDCVRLNKAEYKIVSSYKEIGSIVFMHIHSYNASNPYDYDEDALDAISFSRYRAVYCTVLEQWRIQYIDEYHRCYRNIGTLPDTDDINDIIDFMIKDINRM